MSPSQLETYTAFCGWSLARSHARSGAACRISGYLGSGGAFDRAVADFAALYADQMETDHKALLKAIKNGQLTESHRGTNGTNAARKRRTIAAKA